LAGSVCGASLTSSQTDPIQRAWWVTPDGSETDESRAGFDNCKCAVQHEAGRARARPLFAGSGRRQSRATCRRFLARSNRRCRSVSPVCSILPHHSFQPQQKLLQRIRVRATRSPRVEIFHVAQRHTSLAQRVGGCPEIVILCQPMEMGTLHQSDSWRGVICSNKESSPRNRAVSPVIARNACDEAIHLALCTGMDCFAEPVIGRAFARPVGSQ
jgi:hypothetical protein